MFSRAKKTPLAEWWWTVDRELLAALVLLLLCGFMLSFAASPPVAERLGLSSWHFVIRHGMFTIPALAIMVGVSLFSAKQVRIASLIVLVGSIVLLGVTWKFGVEIKGGRRWISIMGSTLQPSEFVKPAFAVIAAWLFSEKMKHPDMPAQSLALGLLALIVTLLLLQPDFGQTVLLILTWAALLFLVGISWWLIGVLAGAASGGIVIAYMVFPHVARRIDGFLFPEGKDNYQVEHALESMLEGGWFGRGPGEALVRRDVPDAHADFVFSATAGEFGILFCLLLVGLIAFITLRALFIAQKQPRLFARLGASILAIQYGLQSGINLAVNLRLIPAKGMTLPFVSYGGTSILATAFAFGIILALTRRRPEDRLMTGIPAFHRTPAPST